MNEEETRLETAIQAEMAFGLERLQQGRKIPLEANPDKVKKAQADFRGANLSRANLSAMNLIEVQFESAILRSTNFQGANLIGARLPSS